MTLKDSLMGWLCMQKARSDPHPAHHGPRAQSQEKPMSTTGYGPTQTQREGRRGCQVVTPQIKKPS